MPRIIERSEQTGPDRVEQILLADGDAVLRHIRQRLETSIREHRARQHGSPTVEPWPGACIDITPAQARARALLADL
jgi:hypothetical protein